MAAPSRTGGLTALATQSVSANSVVKSSDIDLSGKIGALFHIWWGRGSASAGGAPVNIRIDTSPKTSGDDTWSPFVSIPTAYAACESEAVSGTVNSGTNVITVASTTNLTAGDLVCIVNGTVANSEWGRVKSISTNTSITIEDNLTNAQTGATIYDSAEYYTPIWVSGCMRARVVVDAANFTQASVVRALYDTEDSFA